MALAPQAVFLYRGPSTPPNLGILPFVYSESLCIAFTYTLKVSIPLGIVPIVNVHLFTYTLQGHLA